ncbi:hypothetical protein, partial [Enterobacter cloacae complex sp. 4DZ1-17B1]|uniref:hypothetical protein n=1 Tax=Enterobacter cloacae complex sp. 4DZ1-17B1 TaxID=2511991 RepID=UPI001CA5BCEA
MKSPKTLWCQSINSLSGFVLTLKDVKEYISWLEANQHDLFAFLGNFQDEAIQHCSMFFIEHVRSLNLK